jgi:propane monooxygenase reductase component
MVPPSPRQATVRAVRALTPSLVELRVEVERPLSFRAGQYVEFTVDGTAERRSYSLVSAPSSDRELVFCIKRIKDGMFSGAIDQLRPGWPLNLEAPFGTMFLRDTGRPVLAAAIGSGIAPIMSILTDAAEREVPFPIRFYYGARTAADLPYLEEIATLSKRLPDFEFIPCLSGESPGLQFGRLRRMTRVIAEGIKDASAYDAYLCGAPEMCDTVGRLLEAKGLSGGRIHADRFYPAIPTPNS